MCIWEQGSNLGHLSHLKSSVQAALNLGHEVFLVARELQGIPTVFKGLPVVCLQAPLKHGFVVEDQSAYLSMTHIIFRQCFSSVPELVMYIRAWRGLFDLVRPDLVLFEHAPTALIASLGYTFKRVLAGNGFSIPPQPADSSKPFAVFITTPSKGEVFERLHRDDLFVKNIINSALELLDMPTIQRMEDIYQQADEQLLFTCAALDHFGARAVGYLGVERVPPQRSPEWPSKGRSKVFAYLGVFPGLENLLIALKESFVSAILYVNGLSESLRQKYTSDSIEFLDQLVDLYKVGEQADWVITHGNHISTSIFAESGVPQLLIPLHQEHLFVGLRMQNEHGCAVLAYQDQSGYAAEVMEMISSQRLRSGSIALAQQCALFPKIETSCYVEGVIKRLLN
ncbi:MAG: hypothetical protein CFE44_03075 [Burkholderiales bacterium PBB4]|nr:MAG: hypothetical protein CFE44_03075 [Burkholderiales bacterium PBB4]